MGQKVFQDFSHDLTLNMIGDMEGHRCDPRMNLDFDDTWYKHVATENFRKYGCSVPWHPIFSFEDNSKIEICNKSSLGMKAVEKFVDSKDAPLSKELVPCAMYDINLGPTAFGDHPKNEAYVKLYLETEIKMKKMVIYYDSTTFAAEIGGYVGMFLVISLIDLAILFNASLLVLIQKLYG